MKRNEKKRSEEYTGVVTYNGGKDWRGEVAVSHKVYKTCPYPTEVEAARALDR